jgi:hypothetical protein
MKTYDVFDDAYVAIKEFILNINTDFSIDNDIIYYKGVEYAKMPNEEDLVEDYVSEYKFNYEDYAIIMAYDYEDEDDYKI